MKNAYLNLLSLCVRQSSRERCFALISFKVYFCCDPTISNGFSLKIGLNLRGRKNKSVRFLSLHYTGR